MADEVRLDLQANKEKPSGRKSYQDGFFMAKYGQKPLQ